MVKTDLELLGDIEEVKKKFILLGFKGSLNDFLTDLVNSKQNKLDKVIFHEEDFLNVGTKEKPVLRVKFPQQSDLTELENRLKRVEQYINTLDTF